MKNKIIQLNFNNDKDRSSLSGFVVDLRKNIDNEIKHVEPIIEKKIVKTEKKIKEIEYKIKKKKDKEINYLRKEVKIFNPVLSELVKKISEIKFFKKKKPKRKSSNSVWLEIYGEKLSNFRNSIKNKTVLNKKLSKLEKRAKKAELKVAWYRSIFSFVLVLILIITPIKLLSYFELLDIDKFEKKILGQSELAVNNLMAASNAISKMDFKVADSEFQKAADNFLSAKEDLDKVNDSLLSLAALSDSPKLKLAAESKKFLRAGAIASSLGRNLVLSTDSLFSGSQDNFSESLNNFVFYGNLAVQDAKNLKKELSKINTKNLPSQYREKFNIINKQVALISNNLESFVKSGSKFNDLLGATQDKRYLLVFQNNAELRASGGFLGSYALVDVHNGKIKNLEVPGGGSYDTEGGMSVSVVAPKPLWLVNPLWHFWDANWWPNWPTTAKNLMWFYEKSGGPTVDGVISVTPNIIEDLLDITGPIDLTREHGVIVTANNFWETVQKVVEYKNLEKTNPESILEITNKASSSPLIDTAFPIKQGLEFNSDNKPKKIIGDLMAKILEVLPKKLNKDNLIKILALCESNLSEKQVLFYFTNNDLQKEFSNRNWAGETRQAKYDYLMIVNTNIAGQKSDKKIIEKINHLSEVASDGSIINTVTISRTHLGIKNEAMTGVRNVDWLRIYVPLGSELIEANGFIKPDDKYLQEKPETTWEENNLLKKENDAYIFEPSGTKIYEEDNKTVFANWIMVDPGEEKIITIKYRLHFNLLNKVEENNLPKKISDLFNFKKINLFPYSFMLQKQAGASSSEFSSNLVLPSEWTVFWSYPENLKNKNGWSIKDSINSDKYWSILIEKK